MLQANVLLLNADYTPLGVISWKKAVKLMAKGKAEVVAAADIILYNAERTVKFILPKILRLIKFIRTIFKSRVPYNKRNVLLRDNFTCAYCGTRSTSRMSLDHVQPKSKGGKTNFENIVTCCIPCNNKKDDRTCRESGMFPRHVQWPATAPTVMEFIRMQIKRLGLENTLKEIGL
jgi:5-methylcytosine-specific restriction endonuclease McrA